MNELEKMRCSELADMSAIELQESFIHAKKLISIRHTGVADLDIVMSIYDHSRHKMRESGNMTQWVNGYPSRSIIAKDIDNGNSYVIVTENGIIGVFTFIIGEDPNYSTIDGEWPDNSTYGTIHRIASAPGAHGIADIALDFCMKSGIDIRIDTHADNAPMLGWIAKRRFKYCGIIHVEDGTPRNAFIYRQLQSSHKTKRC